MKIIYHIQTERGCNIEIVTDADRFYLQFLIQVYKQANSEWRLAIKEGSPYVYGQNDPELNLVRALESEKRNPHKFKYSTVPKKVWKRSQSITNHLIN